jgi:hypothetical protein
VALPRREVCKCIIIPYDRFGGGSVMVWSGISTDGLTDHYLILGVSLTAVKYLDEILEPTSMRYAGAIGDVLLIAR